MKKTAGYFRVGSNDGGLTIHAWSLRPSAASVKRSETSPIAISDSFASLTCVRAAGAAPSRPTVHTSVGRVRAFEPKTTRRPDTALWVTLPPVQNGTGGPPAAATR